MHFYNEIDPYEVEWLRKLQAAGEIPMGVVDGRSIEDVEEEDLKNVRQAHFFAGIGGWAYALRLAGWPESRPVWTGSCPCQPFSVAGHAGGLGDKRHLWPAFYRLISECRPPVVFGEQVASEDGRRWFSGVRCDLEDLGYAVGASDLCSAGVGAPQLRQRLYWVAHAAGKRSRTQKPRNRPKEAQGKRAHQTSSYRRFVDGFGNAYRIPEPEVPFLADGFPGVLDQIRAAGNAIDPYLAAEFVGAYLDLDESGDLKETI